LDSLARDYEYAALDTIGAFDSVNRGKWAIRRQLLAALEVSLAHSLQQEACRLRVTRGGQ